MSIISLYKLVGLKLKRVYWYGQGTQFSYELMVKVFCALFDPKTKTATRYLVMTTFWKRRSEKYKKKTNNSWNKYNENDSSVISRFYDLLPVNKKYVPNKRFMTPIDTIDGKGYPFFHFFISPIK